MTEQAQTTISFYGPVELKARIEHLARQQRRSFSNMTCLLLTEMLARLEAPNRINERPLLYAPRPIEDEAADSLWFTRDGVHDEAPEM